MTKFVVASLLLLSLAACGPEPDTPLGTIVTDGQYRVTRGQRRKKWMSLLVAVLRAGNSTTRRT
jgi:hypothetical protein